MLIPVSVAWLGFGLVHLLAFGGALIAVAVVWRLARTTSLSSLTALLLTGYAVGSLLAAGLSMAMYVSGAQLRQIVFYLLGSFSGASWPQLAAAAPLVVIGSVLILLRARSLNALLLGDETAANLGIDVRRERAILLGLASLVTAAAVAVSGLIGFVGLVVPHVVRLRGRTQRAARAAALGALRGRLPDLRRPRRAHPGRAAGGRRDGHRRRAVLPGPPAPGSRRLRGLTMVAPSLTSRRSIEGWRTQAPSRGPAHGRPTTTATTCSGSASRTGRARSSTSSTWHIGDRRARGDPGAQRRRQVEPAADPDRATRPERRGAVRLDGLPLESYSRETLARRVAVVPGEVSLPFAARVEEVVALGRIPHEHPFRGLRDADDAAVEAAIERVGIGDLAAAMPGGCRSASDSWSCWPWRWPRRRGCSSSTSRPCTSTCATRSRSWSCSSTLNERDGVGVIAVLHDLSLAAHFFPRLVLLDHGSHRRRRAAGRRPLARAHPRRLRRRPGARPPLVVADRVSLQTMGRDP